MIWARTTTCVCPSQNLPSRCVWACDSFHHSRKATLKAAEVTLQTRDFIFLKRSVYLFLKKLNLVHSAVVGNGLGHRGSVRPSTMP